MNVAIPIVDGDDADIDAVLDIVPLQYDTRWEKGESRRNGKIYESSGMSAKVVDAENPKALAHRIRGLLEQCRDKGIASSAHNLVAELSVGFTVGDSKQFVTGLEFSAADLLMFAECRIAISISAYPTSDEVNAEQNAINRSTQSDALTRAAGFQRWTSASCRKRTYDKAGIHSFFLPLLRS